jgi:hypothetical protein
VGCWLAGVGRRAERVEARAWVEIGWWPGRAWRWFVGGVYRWLVRGEFAGCGVELEPGRVRARRW